MIVLLILIACAAAALFAFTRLGVRRIERRFPAIGERFDVGGYSLHAVHMPKPEGADLPPVVFIHGASGNLRDPLGAFSTLLAGRAEMLFVDRPGHGYSDRGVAANEWPDGQARAIATLMRRKGIEKAIVVGHSFGGAIAASFAVALPEMTAGLVFIAPATHPWPGGVAWYNTLTRRPFLGRLFAGLVALPAGLALIGDGMRSVFAPNPMPRDYVETAPALVLRPRSFRANAIDLSNLYDHVSRMAGRYGEISARTVIVTGDSDTVVLPDLHSRGLYRDIAGSELVWVRNLGHKPDYVAGDLCIAAIEKAAGRDRDLQAMAREVELRLGAKATSEAPRMPGQKAA